MKCSICNQTCDYGHIHNNVVFCNSCVGHRCNACKNRIATGMVIAELAYCTDCAKEFTPCPSCKYGSMFRGTCRTRDCQYDEREYDQLLVRIEKGRAQMTDQDTKIAESYGFLIGQSVIGTFDHSNDVARIAHVISIADGDVIIAYLEKPYLRPIFIKVQHGFGPTGRYRLRAWRFDPDETGTEYTSVVHTNSTEQKMSDFIRENMQRAHAKSIMHDS